MISDYTCLAINDTKLLIYNVIFIFLQLLVTGAGVLLVTTYLNKDSKKQRVIRKKLIEKAKTDPYAKKKLDKMERKRKKSIKQEWIEKALMLAIIIICVVVNLFWCIIPGLTDYIKKDYVVYSGEFSVNLSYSDNLGSFPSGKRIPYFPGSV